MSTSRRAGLRMIDLRLGQAGERLDTIVARMRKGRGLVYGRTFWRVDALRASEAHLRARAREVRAAGQSGWTACSDQLQRDLVDLETQIAISSARLDADLAVGDAAFASAVQAELDAWTAYVHAAAPTPHAEPDNYLAGARYALENFRQASLAGSASLKAEVCQAIEDLDRAADNGRLVRKTTTD